ncbi:MAG: lysylphosphatidylglycerol synthase transmembrane domain-containing protein [Bacteroidales bacterium]
MKQKIINALKVFVSLGLGIYIFWLVYRNADMDQMKQILSDGVSYELLFVSGIIGLLSHIARAKRWQMLIQPLGVRPTVKELTNAIFVNYGVNIILPRVGEFTRCGMVAKKCKLKFTEVVGTLVSERFTDVMTVLLIVLAAFAMQVNTFIRFFKENGTVFEKVDGVLTSPWFYIIILMITVFTYAFFKNFGHFSIVSRTKQVIRNLWSGAMSIRKMESSGAYLFYSFLIWFLYFVQLYVMVKAFLFTQDVTLLVCFIAFAMTAIAGAVPVQGGIGAWHFAVITTFVYYGTGQTEAAAFALVAHLLTTFLNALWGAFGFLAATNRLTFITGRNTSNT